MYNIYITLPTKIHIVKAMVFPIVMYGCESWTVKKAEHRRIDAFELWCWRRLVRVPWPARWSNQSILKEISPEYSLEGLMQKLKLQYLGHLMQRADSLEKTLMLERERARGEGGNRVRDGWMSSLTQWTWVWGNSRSWWWTGRPGVLQSMGLQRVGHDWVTELNWLMCLGFPHVSVGKESACQAVKHRFNPCMRKIPWRRQPTSVFLPGGYSPWGRKESDTTECTLTHTYTQTHCIYKYSN